MKIGDFIRFRFQFPTDGYIVPWRYGIIIEERDKTKDIAIVYTDGKIIKVLDTVIEVIQETNERQ
jgi:hypothetical protein